MENGDWPQENVHKPYPFNIIMIGWMDRWMDATNKMATEKPVISIKSDAMSSNLTYGCTMSNLSLFLLLPLPPPPSSPSSLFLLPLSTPISLPFSLYLALTNMLVAVHGSEPVLPVEVIGMFSFSQLQYLIFFLFFPFNIFIGV